MDILDRLVRSCFGSFWGFGKEDGGDSKYIDYGPTRKWRYNDQNLIKELGTSNTTDVVQLASEDGPTSTNIKLRLHDNVFLNEMNQDEAVAELAQMGINRKEIIGELTPHIAQIVVVENNNNVTKLPDEISYEVEDLDEKVAATDSVVEDTSPVKDQADVPDDSSSKDVVVKDEEGEIDEISASGEVLSGDAVDVETDVVGEEMVEASDVGDVVDVVDAVEQVKATVTEVDVGQSGNVVAEEILEDDKREVETKSDGNSTNVSVVSEEIVENLGDNMSEEVTELKDDTKCASSVEGTVAETDEAMEDTKSSVELDTDTLESDVIDEKQSVSDSDLKPNNDENVDDEPMTDESDSCEQTTSDTESSAGKDSGVEETSSEVHNEDPCNKDIDTASGTVSPESS